MADPFTAALVLAGASTVIGMKGAKDEHRANQAQMARRKAELERNAVVAKAVAQREGFEEDRKAKLVVSRARALAAFSGAGVDDSTMLNVISDIEGEGEYRRNVALYKGQEEARRMLEGAEATAEAMKAENKAYKTKQLTNVLNFGASAMMMGGGARAPAPSFSQYPASTSTWDEAYAGWGDSGVSGW